MSLCIPWKYTIFILCTDTSWKWVVVSCLDRFAHREKSSLIWRGFTCLRAGFGKTKTLRFLHRIQIRFHSRPNGRLNTITYIPTQRKRGNIFCFTTMKTHILVEVNCLINLKPYEWDRCNRNTYFPLKLFY